MLPPAPVAAGRHPDAQGVRGTYARGGDEIGPVGKQLYWTYAAKCGARVGGPWVQPAARRLVSHGAHDGDWVCTSRGSAKRRWATVET